MHKQIIHFGQNPDKEEFYNLVVKSTDIPSQQELSELKNELLRDDFIISFNDENVIKAYYKHRYLEVMYKFRHLESEEWRTSAD